MNVDKTFINKLLDKYKQNILKAIEILKKYKIKEIYIFSSLAKEKYRKDSDCDYQRFVNLLLKEGSLVRVE